MAIEPGFQVRLGIYRIDDGVLALRDEIWKLLDPRLEAITEEHIANVIKCAPFYKTIAEKGGQAHAQTIRAYTEKLLKNPLDEEWVKDAYMRARFEVGSGYDMRSRAAISASILVRFKEYALQRHRFSARRAADLIDAATRIFMLDSANAVFCHQTFDVQKSKIIAEELTAAIRSFNEKIEGVRGAVGAAISSLGTSSDDLAKLAGDASEQTKNAVKAAQDTAHKIKTIASATEQLSTAIDDLQTRTLASVQIAQTAVSHSEESNSNIRSLSETVQRVGSIVETISSIAAQTNLLALNATIEAARAGEAGRGFAVVATEVKTLAVQTAKATEDISNQISAIQQAMRSSMNEIETTGLTIAKISSDADAVATTIAQQSNATNEIARNATGAAKNAVIVTEALRTIEETVLRALQGTKAVLALADNLARQSSEIDEATETLFAAAAKNSEVNELAELARAARQR
jgi:methyl-accepting chemotaxis protein